MADILQQIIASKLIEVREAKIVTSIASLEDKISLSEYPSFSMEKALQEQPGIIAEFKRASPSKGVIRSMAKPAEIVKGYDVGGAVAISVLTDTTYFKAEPQDFTIARQSTQKPLLRKEFIIDEYQIYESKAMGANLILLIAAVLSKQEIKQFTRLAHKLRLEVLIELHSSDEIGKLCGEEDVIGVNNRNLKTFEVDINQSIKVKNQLGATNTPLVSESGLSSITEVEQLLSEGFRGFLMGEYFMKQEQPVNAFADFNNALYQLIKQ
ncbi:MAG: indole-3-glycerol phosphate synthase TrpC [Cyclobacteriaceae bacterium]|nr:indole-3-glycerol phosphate synthase TrpC [Cyclobacteriaceae bacterium]